MLQTARMSKIPLDRQSKTFYTTEIAFVIRSFNDTIIASNLVILGANHAFS